MQIENSAEISAVKIITPVPFVDERGSFARIFCVRELAEALNGKNIEQINYSSTKIKGSIRGMHFQKPPHSEIKIVRCTKGSIFDVAVDLRKNSPTFLKWHGEILSEQNGKMLLVPEGFAHGFQTLENNVEMIYSITASYCKESEGSIRFDEPLASIEWKLPPAVLSQKDLSVAFLDGGFRGI
ncbi:dTDP-4-dehydrorhamnose 3,5-epimerase [Fibrobacteria bacterium R8-3-H12]